MYLRNEVVNSCLDFGGFVQRNTNLLLNFAGKDDLEHLGNRAPGTE